MSNQRISLIHISRIRIRNTRNSNTMSCIMFPFFPILSSVVRIRLIMGKRKSGVAQQYRTHKTCTQTYSSSVFNDTNWIYITLRLTISQITLFFTVISYSLDNIHYWPVPISIVPAVVVRFWFLFHCVNRIKLQCWTMSSKFVVMLVAMVYFWYSHEQILTCYSCQLRWIKKVCYNNWISFENGRWTGRTGHWNEKTTFLYLGNPPDAISSIHSMHCIPSCLHVSQFDSITFHVSIFSLLPQ